MNISNQKGRTLQFFLLCTLLSGKLLAQTCTFPPNVVSTTVVQAIGGYPFDLDNDGHIDILSASNVTSTIYYHRNFVNQNFVQQSLFIVNGGIRDFVPTDLDMDGDNDILSLSNDESKINFHRRNSIQTYDLIEIITPIPVTTLVPSDLDLDGDKDLVWAGNESGGSIRWLKNDGNEEFTLHTISSSVGSIPSLDVIDLDKDGDQDIVAAGGSFNKFYWLENNGSQSFTRHDVAINKNSPVSAIAIDFDKDGDIDIVGASKLDDRIDWFENNGAQVFTPRTIFNAINDIRSMKVIDLDMDGNLDVLTASFATDRIIWFKNNGCQSFSEQIISTSGDGSRFVSVEDVDKDGDPDVFSASFNDDKITWYENDCVVPTCTEMNLSVNDDPIMPKTYQAVNTLSSSGRVQNGCAVTFKAGSTITLNQNFYAEGGSNFQAIIENCPANSLENNTESGIEISELIKQKIPDQHQNANFQIVPNPTKGVSNLHYEITELGPINITIYSMQGTAMQLVLSKVEQEKGQYQIPLNLTNLPRGIYLMGLRTKRNLITKKMIVLD